MGVAYTPSFFWPALKSSTHALSALCCRSNERGSPNSVPVRWFASLCDGERAAISGGRIGLTGMALGGRRAWNSELKWS